MQYSSVSALSETPSLSSRASTLHASVLETWSQVVEIQEEWNTVLQRSSANSLFLTWEWLSAWAQAGGARCRTFVICVRDEDGKLVGIAPLYLTTLRLGGLLSYRTLRIMASVATGAEYPDVIALPEVEADVIQVIAETLKRSRNRWDCLWLPNIATWTGAEERWLKVCRAADFLFHSRAHDFGAFTLPPNMESYVRSLSSNKRQQLRGELKRIKGRPTVTVKKCESIEQIPQFLDRLFELHYRRWQTRGEEGSFRRKPELAEFYKHFVPQAQAKRWLWLFALEDVGEIKAVQLGYVYNRVFYQIQEGFDPEYENGAGNVLRAHVIEACIAEGVETYDFLGGMTEHKRRWRAQERIGCDLFIGRRTMKNVPLFTAEVWPTGRFLKPVM